MKEDQKAIAALGGISDLDAVHTIEHYLYVPTREIAAATADELRRRGFQVEDRLGADGSSWLVLARQEVVPSESNIEAARGLLEDLASQVGGEYDGWEAAVSRSAAR